MTPPAVLPCLDSPDLAAACQRAILIPRERAAMLARETLDIVRAGRYRSAGGRDVSIGDAVAAACRATVSIAPDMPFPAPPRDAAMTIQVTNETTQGAARRLAGSQRVIALNFANGFTPGGGFLHGARAQEEALCRASALYETIRRDPMYDHHARLGDGGTSDHAILSPDVPFFRDELGQLLDAPYRLSVLTCAAPMAQEIGLARAAMLLRARIERVLAIMAGYDYDSLILGAWGCGAFRNDPARTAADFRAALHGPFRGAFRTVVFAVADWSPERRTLGPFRDAFQA